MSDEQDSTGEAGSAGVDADALTETARQYLDLWQDQLTALSANPAVSEAIAGFFANWAPGGAPAGATAQAGTSQGEGGARHEPRHEPGHEPGPGDVQSATVAEAPGSASVVGRDRLGELLERLDRIEERLARLEQS